MRRPLQAALFALLLLPATASADEVSDAIAQASKSYAERDFAGARSALGEAMQFLAQKAAAGMGAALPKPLPGWTAPDADTNDANMAMMGGGSQVARRYENGQGQHVEIRVIADSPMVAPMAMAMSNPAMAGSMGKLVRVGTLRAIQTREGDIQMLVDNRILVMLSGDAAVEAKLDYARAMDLAKLTAQ
jgi:hypothetical protein